jgi:hypothetical protein
MFCLSLALAMLLSSGPSPSMPFQGQVDPKEWRAFHEKDVRTWSLKSGLSISVIERLLAAVGHEDSVDDDSYSIGNIDAKSLAKRGQILIALNGPPTSHALSVYVVRAKPPYAYVWKLFGLDENGSCPAQTFAIASLLGEGTASVTRRGEILVRLPMWKNQDSRASDAKKELLVASFTWTGTTYRLNEERIFSTYHWNGSDVVEEGAGTLQNCEQQFPHTAP